MSDIQEKIKTEIEAAREACSTDDPESCASAWDAVEELQAEASHQRAKEAEKSPFDKYCDDNPEADECRVYDN
ncbi:MAG: Calvin cycle protein CP12 [Cyanobacteria bacterium J06634_6]